jgi:hypothetical protein
MLVRLNHKILALGLALMVFLLMSCDPPPPPVLTDIPPTEAVQEETEAESEPIATPTVEPSPTPLPPTPIVTSIVEKPGDDSKTISSGEQAIITLEIEAIGPFSVKIDPGRGTIKEQADGVYEYTAPDEGGLDTVTFIVEGDWGETQTQVVFQVLDIQVLSPEQEVGCPTRIACGFTVRGTSAGLSDDMQIVVFVNPLDSSIDSWWRYPVSEQDEDGNWQQDVFVREDRIFAGYEFAIKALILPRETVPELPRSMDELPSDQFASSPTLSLKTVSPRPSLGDPRYPGQVVISSPLNLTGGIVHNNPVTFMGSTTSVPDTMEIWAVIYVEETGSYYPQNHSNCPNAGPASRTGDSWEAPHVSFGGEGEIQFDVVIVVVEPESEASTFFREYLTNGCRTGDFPGLTAEELGVTHEETAITLVVGD